MKKINIITIIILINLTFITLPNCPEAADKRIISFVTCNWGPYFGENLPDGGYLTEISRAAFERAGYGIEVTFVPWKRAFIKAKNGNYDGLIGVYHSKEREKHFTYSELIDSEVLVFFSLIDRRIKYSSLEDLKSYKIGMMRGMIHSEEFDNAKYLNKIEGTDIEQNLKRLMTKRIDIMVSGKNPVIHIVNTKYPEWKNKIEIVQPPLTNTPLHNAISKKIIDHEAIVKAFNLGLQEIRNDGTFEKIKSKYNFADLSE